MEQIDSRANYWDYGSKSSVFSQSQELPNLISISQLSEAQANHYVNVKARLVSFAFDQITDKMGQKTILKGTIEDSSLRLPLRSHRLFSEIEKGQVYSFESAFVHEFPDSSLMIVLTERSRMKQVSSDDSVLDEKQALRYFWRPRIGEITRPIWNINLNGVITRIYRNSGLVNRCNTCRQIVYTNECPKGCPEGSSWDFRISCDLTDRTGSIRTIFGREIAARLIGRSVSEILYATNCPYSDIELRSKPPISYRLLPSNGSEIEVTEIAVEDATKLRSPEYLLVTEGFNLAYLPKGSEIPKDLPSDAIVSTRKLEWRKDPQDAKIYRKLLRRLLEQKFAQSTRTPLANGLFLFDDPIQLYATEKAKLFLGFRFELLSRGDVTFVEVSPQSSVLESVWDFVMWRRNRGASAKSLELALLEKRFSAILAPLGRLGTIREVQWEKAGDTFVSEMDRRTLSEYWKDLYDIDVDDEETPILKIQPIESSGTALFTYAPSQVFFDDKVIPTSSRLRKFRESKEASLESKTRSVIRDALMELKLGDCTFECMEDVSNSSTGVSDVLLSEVRQALMRKEIRARGEISKFGDRLYFLPQFVRE